MPRHRSRSSGCTPEVHPSPHSCSIDRPVKSSQPLLKKMHSLSVPDIQIRTGAVSADTAPVLIWMSGTDKLCIFFNRGWLDFTGRSMEQEWGDGWTSGVHPDDLERCLGIYSSAFDSRVDFQMEYRLRRFDGQYRWIVDYGVPRFESNGIFCGYIGSCVDVTHRKLSETSLRELSGRLIHAQEEERARIARELHDDLSQRMALLQISLDQLQQQIPGLSSQSRQQLQSIKEVATEV